MQSSLPAGWLNLYREGVKPSGPLQKVSDHSSSSSGLGLAQGKFHHDVIQSVVRVSEFMEYALRHSVDLQPERFDDWRPEYNIGCEGPSEFFGV